MLFVDCAAKLYCLPIRSFFGLNLILLSYMYATTEIQLTQPPTSLSIDATDRAIDVRGAAAPAWLHTNTVVVQLSTCIRA